MVLKGDQPMMTREEAIVLFEKQLTAAQVVLDSGFGSNPGENDSLYRRRKEMAEIALTALTTRQAEDEKLRAELEQLREMDGEPVYVASAIGEHSAWYIVDLEENELKNPWDRISLENWDEGYPYTAYLRLLEEEKL